MEIHRQIAEQNKQASKSGECFRVDHFERLQADYAERFKTPENKRCVGGECGA